MIREAIEDTVLRVPNPPDIEGDRVVVMPKGSQVTIDMVGVRTSFRYMVLHLPVLSVGATQSIIHDTSQTRRNLDRRDGTARTRMARRSLTRLQRSALVRA